MNADIELIELRRSWQALERRLEAQQALNTELATQTRVDKAKARLRPLLVGQVIQAAVGIACTVFFARFWLAHLDAPAALLSGVLMHAWSVALVVSAATELLLVMRINYAQPVLAIQKYLGVLQYWRTRMAPLLGLAFWVLWLPLVAVLLKHFTGADVSGWFLWANIAVGVVGLVGTLWGVRHLRRRGHRFADAIDADNAGCGVRSAQALLADIRRFEAE
ncbi:hypothetical protein [Lysobacter sp. A3-1-A15]|uniref:hypothetical protein n=1 Tax=Novilysobacter viscosus TaxID=3098602 RepID=UPI002ED9B4AE